LRRYPDGWRAEICLDALPWMREIAGILRRGFVLTIDYGDTARRLYTPDRRRGTLAVYARHQMGARPLAQPGSQDVTAHVNFTALVAAGRASGLRLAGLTTQGELLRRLGLVDEMEALGARLFPAADTERHTDRGQADHLRRMSLRGAVSTLLNPHGLGGFRVLAQQRGVPGAGRVLQGFVRQLHGSGT
jgi:SAM-dependent MidA family methyltransferase